MTAGRLALRRWLLLAAAVAVLTAGCRRGEPAFHSIDVTGAQYARGFDAIDAAGRRRSVADWRGKAVLVFFGYTQCPDVCPTALARAAEAMRRLGALGDRVQAVFVTVDPERDTDAIVDAYAKGFDPRFVGLRFDAATTAAIAREFRVVYTKAPLPDSRLGYAIDHTALSYVFDPQGRIRLVVRHEQTAEQIAADLGKLLRAG
ncbi:MAG: SCO family protein [Burkholderiaceae bacterium]